MKKPKYNIYYKKGRKTTHTCFGGYPSRKSAVIQFHELHPRTKILTVRKK